MNKNRKMVHGAPLAPDFQKRGAIEIVGLFLRKSFKKCINLKFIQNGTLILNTLN